MITILSQQFEETTIHVVNWLRYYKAKYTRINGDEWSSYKAIINFEIKNGSNKENLPAQTNAVWFRRWGRIKENKSLTIDNDLQLSLKIEEDLYNEYHKLRNYFWSRFKNKQWINHPDQSLSVNKLEILQQAAGLDLNIPDSLVTNRKKALISFFKNTCHEQMIGKTIGDISSYVIDNQYYGIYTHQFTEEQIASLPDVFFPCMFQKAIPKAYEVRSFYLNGKFYSMAIFSQLDTQTAVDFRHYNTEKPNRNVPYQLSKDTEKKLKKLFKVLNLNSGSADIIRGKDGKDYFLEINPVGQFGMVSTPCRYYLEEKMADYLIKLNNQ